MTGTEDYAVVYPPEGGITETARLLLELAADPTEVLTTGNGTAFRIPAHVADAYMDRLTAPVKRTRRTNQNKGA